MAEMQHSQVSCLRSAGGKVCTAVHIAAVPVSSQIDADDKNHYRDATLVMKS